MTNNYFDDVGARTVQLPQQDEFDLMSGIGKITGIVLRRHYPELNEPAPEGVYKVDSAIGKAIEAVVQDRLTALPAYGGFDSGQAAEHMEALKAQIGAPRMASVLRDINRCVTAHAKDAGLQAAREI